MTSPPVLKPYPWRLFWLLFVGEVLAVLAVVPAGIELLGPIISKQPLPNAPLPLLILVGVIQNVALLAFTVWLGLKLSRRLGLGAPLLESWLSRGSESRPRRTHILQSGILTGVVLGIVLVLALLVLVPRLPNLPFVVVARLSIWKRFLMCFYGGVYEELLTRLFLLTLVAWIANRSWRNTVPKLSNSAFWFANVFTAIIFGLGHLPSASLFMPITPLVVVAALLLNGVAGIAFGYLYRRDGLEAAMIAHFTCDVMIWVVGPVFIKS
ncbi:MAG TPA: CPBP family intramembrane glutamic endopeptidase [Pyrinomonadaceae bacterium]|jgi:membrane protease YdiL (CAAX protease family)|nr:CPBP family intramembrane glutamic endopeptidase [Pyrinomonadaceae bacterium]